MYLSPGSKNYGDVVERWWPSRRIREKIMLLVDIFRVMGFGVEVFFRGLSVHLFFFFQHQENQCVRQIEVVFSRPKSYFMEEECGEEFLDF